jgi:hypothetical protein
MPMQFERLAAALRGLLLACWLGPLVAAPALAQGPAGTDSTASPVSAAEKLLFQADHLSRLKAPLTLRYAFAEQGGKEGDVQDKVSLQLNKGSDGKCCAVQGSYLSGARALGLPEVPDARSNPVLLFFLEHQVRQMAQLTGGQSAHFRRRIRTALADEAKVEAITMAWGGREVPAQRVSISPFLNDSQRHRFDKRAATQYSFVYSDAVPGGVLQLGAVLADGDARVKQTLTLQADDPAARAAAK